MKMDAAEPFNVPVNPIALGIPVSIYSLADILLPFCAKVGCETKLGVEIVFATLKCAYSCFGISWKMSL